MDLINNSEIISRLALKFATTAVERDKTGGTFRFVRMLIGKA